MYKLIAIDLDGTLLSDQKKFDFERFVQQTRQLKQKGTQIVIATGNQYIKTTRYFPDFIEELLFITDNGSTIHFGKELHTMHVIEQADYQQFMTQLAPEIQKEFVISVENDAVVLKNPSDQFTNALTHHYPVVREIEDLAHLNEPVIKLTFKLAENYHEDDPILLAVQQALPTSWRMVHSGFGFFDILPQGISKLTALKELQEQLHFTKEEIIAFGDSSNDFEILDYLPLSFAMGNASENVKAAASHVIGTNNEQAVLDTIETLFEL